MLEVSVYKYGDLSLILESTEAFPFLFDAYVQHSDGRRFQVFKAKNGFCLIPKYAEDIAGLEDWGEFSVYAFWVHWYGIVKALVELKHGKNIHFKINI